jgi:hypothetical protein
VYQDYQGRNANGGFYRFDPDGANQAVPAPAWLIKLATAKTRDRAWAGQLK